MEKLKWEIVNPLTQEGLKAWDSITEIGCEFHIEVTPEDVYLDAYLGVEEVPTPKSDENKILKYIKVSENHYTYSSKKEAKKGANRIYKQFVKDNIQIAQSFILRGLVSDTT